MEAQRATSQPTRTPEAVRLAYQRSLVGILGAALLAFTATLSTSMNALAVFMMAAVVLLGWGTLAGLPNHTTPVPVLALVLTSAIGASLFLSTTALAIVAAASVIATFVAEMARGDTGAQRVEQLSGTVLGAIMMISASMWVLISRQPDGRNIIVVSAAILLIVSLIHIFDIEVSGIFGMLNGVVTGVGMAWVMSVPMTIGLLLGICVAVAFSLIRRGSDGVLTPPSGIAKISRALIPHCALGVIAYTLWAVLF